MKEVEARLGVFSEDIDPAKGRDLGADDPLCAGTLDLDGGAPPAAEDARDGGGAPRAVGDDAAPRRRLLDRGLLTL